MPDTPSITIVKRFTYRDQPEDWANTYHFSGDTPGSAADWRALGLAIWAEERKALTSNNQVATILGYQAGNEHSVFQADLITVAPPNNRGVLGDAGQLPGDVVFTIRWATGQRNSKGRPIYGRKTYHGVQPGNQDRLLAQQLAPAQALGAKLIDGTLPGGFKVCGPQGAVYSAPFVKPFTSIRQLKRRGKRPH